MSYGIFDSAQKAWLHVYDTLAEAEERLLHLDVRTAKVHPFTEEAPAEPEPGAPAAPQEEVAVVGSGATAAIPVPEETPAADPEVAADVSA